MPRAELLNTTIGIVATSAPLDRDAKAAVHHIAIARLDNASDDVAATDYVALLQAMPALSATATLVARR